MAQDDNVQKQIDYYKSRYDEVAVITCNKCKTVVAVEVKGGVDQAGDPSHPEGRQVIPISYPDHPYKMALTSHRVRLDGQIGYECAAIIPNPNHPKMEKDLEKLHKEGVKEYQKAKAQFEKDHKRWEKDVKAYDARVKKSKGKTYLGPRPTEPTLNVAEPIKGPNLEPEYSLCRNTTLVSDQERGKLPVAYNGEAGVPEMTPYERQSLIDEISRANTKPDVEVKGNKKRIETFTIERVK